MKWIVFNKKREQQILYELKMRQHCCAFSGHRPEKVIGLEDRIIVELRKEILKAIDDGYRIFLTGMSRGVDLWAADIVLELRKHNKDLKLVCVIPFEGVEERWSLYWKKFFYMVRKQSDYDKILSRQYSPDAYQIRNAWMVDHSARLIAVFNGEPSGTGNTIQYAQQRQIPVNVIEV